MSIHQQVTIPAGRREIYAILADAAALSALCGMGGTAGRAEGAEFTAFNGHVTGRQVELVPGCRIVQAWRFPDWAPGTYTIVRFTVERDNSNIAGSDADEATILTIDQDGYPDGADALGCHQTWHDHLDEGWRMFYLTPLARHFAEQIAGAKAVAKQEVESMAAAMAPLATAPSATAPSAPAPAGVATGAGRR